MPESADYGLRWPRSLFQTETAALINARNRLRDDDWSSRCELLLEDAFVGPAPKDDFSSRAEVGFGQSPTASEGRQAFLVNLLRRAGTLPETAARAPYWSERRKGSVPGRIPLETVVREVVRMVGDLERRGYFEMAFGKDCVDDPSGNPSDILETELGAPDLWPLHAGRLSKSADTFYDVIEVLHDQIARPRTRWLHNYSGCGWHHGDFSIDTGRALYRWRLNELLNRSDLGLQLADDGEDVGRLVAVTDDARTDLAHSMASRADPTTGDRVRHALALFRGRAATVHDKRSAVVALALVLEERRQLLKDSLFKKDEGALFEIANRFAIRHQDEKQQPDYDPAFLDWIFWWYLATIELTDRLIARSSAVPQAGHLGT
jgi:hypothetical protein